MHFIIVFYPEHKRHVMIFMPVAMWTWFYFVAKCSCMQTVMENKKKSRQCPHKIDLPVYNPDWLSPPLVITDGAFEEKKK